MADLGGRLRAARRWVSASVSSAWSTRRWAVIAVAVVAVAVVAGAAWWASGSSPGRPAATGTAGQHHPAGHGTSRPGVPSPGTPAGGAKPLSAILAADLGATAGRPVLHDCATAASTVAGLRLRAVVDSETCSGPPGSMISLWAYQFSSVLSYEKGFLRLNRVIGWDAAKAGHGCPSVARTTTGRVEWQDPPRYPRQSGQVLDCAPASKAMGPQFVWAMPSQRVLFRAADAQAGATDGSLWAWLRSVHFD